MGLVRANKFIDDGGYHGDIWAKPQGAPVEALGLFDTR